MITPDDRRHGSRAGYLAGCRHTCCTEPNFRYQKRSKIRFQREGTQIVPAAPVRKRVAWWAERGVSINALTAAANLGSGTISELITGERDHCLKGTVRAVLAVRWEHLPDHALCGADLTRARVYSMMAAGHPLDWICEQAGEGFPKSGVWRSQERVTLGTARALQAVYDAAPLEGPSRASAVKARNKGHDHPLAWDDPGVPAMPFGWSPRRTPTIGRPGRPESTAVENFDWLVSQGVTPARAAERLGVQLDSVRDKRRQLERRAS